MRKFMGKKLSKIATAAKGSGEAGITQLRTHKSTLLSISSTTVQFVERAMTLIRPFHTCGGRGPRRCGGGGRHRGGRVVVDGLEGVVGRRAPGFSFSGVVRYGRIVTCQK